MLVRSCLCLTLLIAAAAAPALAQQPPASTSTVTQSYETVKLADGVYAFVAPEGYGAWVTGNSLVVIGDSGVLVVDPGHFPTLTRRHIADIRKLTSQPVRWVVNTHWHPDHWLANGEYKAAFPNATIVSTRVTLDEIEARGPDFIKGHQDSVASIAQFREMLSKGTSPFRPNAPPLLEGERYGLEMSAVDGLAALPGWRQARLQVPTLAFDDSLSIRLGGGREVRLLFLGRGNTAGDAVISVPDAKVVAAGDQVVAPIPYAYGSFIGEWVTALRRLQSLGATTILPGHGPVMRDTTYIASVVEALVSVRAQVRDAVKKGMNLEATRKAVNLDAFERRFEGTDPHHRGQFFIHFFAPATARAFMEARLENGS